jgi:hypothetical protein
VFEYSLSTILYSVATGAKKAEWLARVFDHTTGRFTKGYSMLTLEWSDGFSFAPLDFVDVSQDATEIVRIYGMRWSIETFFKVTKSYLKLGTEFQGRSFDQMISHTTIVFNRYLAMEYERRQTHDNRTLGGLFSLFR